MRPEKEKVHLETLDGSVQSLEKQIRAVNEKKERAAQIRRSRQNWRIKNRNGTTESGVMKRVHLQNGKKWRKMSELREELAKKVQKLELDSQRFLELDQKRGEAAGKEQTL